MKPKSSLSQQSIHNALLRLYYFARFVVQGFVAGNGLRTASALAYTTLLSLVPLFTVVYSVVAAFPAFQGVEEQVRAFIFNNFVPTSGEIVQKYLLDFSQKTSNLTSFGILFLILSALLMLKTIDAAFNSIWGITNRRTPMGSFMMYWAVLTLGPLLIGAGVFVTSSLLSMEWFKEMNSASWLPILPFVSSTVAFSLFYMMIPNRQVPWRNALIGGLIAASMFDLAKRGFVFYVSTSTANETIYGALAVVPLFLLWIYLSWIIVLIGAQMTYALSVFNWQSATAKIHEVDNQFFQAYLLLGHMWQAQNEGKPLTVQHLMQRERWHDEEALLYVLKKLENAHWIGRLERNRWALLRDLQETDLLDLYHLMAGGLASLPQAEEAGWAQNLQIVLERLNTQTVDIMNIPLKQLYLNPETPAAQMQPAEKTVEAATDN